MNKAVIYCRQSGGDNDVSESVENQKQRCLELAQKEGLDVVDIFEDLNTSGKTYPIGSEDIAQIDVAFQKWFQEQTKRKKFRDGLGHVMKLLIDIDYILCYDITRLYRPVTGSFLESHLSQLLVIHNVKVWTVNNGIIDLGNFNDSLIMALQNRINHEQIAIQRKKSMEAFTKLRNSGELFCNLWNMWGYTHGDKKRQVKIVEREAELVRDVFNTFLETDSIIETTKYINNKYTDLIPKPILENNFKNILTKPIYCGYMYNSSGELIKCKQVEGLEIISFDTWNEVHRRLELRKRTKPRAKEQRYPLSGLVHCGECGGNMVIAKCKKVKIYYCNRHHHIAAKPCEARIHSSLKTKYGLGLLEAIYPLFSLSITEHLNASMNKESNKKELDECELKLNNLKTKEQRFSDMYINEMMDEDTFKKSLLKIKTEKDVLNDKIIKLKTLLEEGSDYLQKAVILIDKIVHRSLSYAELKTCINDVIKQIDVRKDSIAVSTIYGELTLPRQVLYKNQKTLPHYYFFPNKKNYAVYYYLGEEKGVMFNKKFTESEHELIAEFPKMKVYLIK